MVLNSIGARGRKEDLVMRKTVSFFVLFLVLCLLLPSALAGTSISSGNKSNVQGDSDLVRRLQEAPEFKFYHAQSGIGHGTCPVYTAPSEDSFRMADGRASVSTNHDLYEAGYSAGWLLVRYETNNGGTNVGYIPPRYVKGYKSRMTLPEFDYIPATALDVVYVTNNPLLPGSFYATLDPEEGFYILGKYTYHGDWWYIECTVDGQMARGFIDRETSSFVLGSQESVGTSIGLSGSSVKQNSVSANPGNPSISPLGTVQDGYVTVDYGTSGQRKNVRMQPDPNSDLVVAAEPGEVFPVYASKVGTTGKVWYYIWVERVSKWGWISSGVATYSH